MLFVGPPLVHWYLRWFKLLMLFVSPPLVHWYLRWFKLLMLFVSPRWFDIQ
jgi:hypothetical protein